MPFLPPYLLEEEKKDVTLQLTHGPATKPSNIDADVPQAAEHFQDELGCTLITEFEVASDDDEFAYLN